MATTYTENKKVKLKQTGLFKTIYRADRTIKVPFTIDLNDHDKVLQCNEIIRILPKKRLLAFGKWGDQEVAIKLFYEPKRAKIHAERDAFGIETLMQSNVPTAKLLYKGSLEKNKIHVLIFEKIQNGVSLEKLWQNKDKLADIDGLLQAVTIELATQHVLGILQKDLHLNNFLITQKNIFTLDGGQIEYFSHPLEKQISIEYLALFFAQLGAGVESLQEKLFDTYTQARGWIVKPADIKLFNKLLSQQSRERLQKYKKKIFRSCSQFQRQDKFNKTVVYDKKYISAEFDQLLKNPDAIIAHANSEMLKNGGSSTVVKATIAGCALVIKRYNHKNIWRWLLRTLRMSRAKKSWSISQQLYASGLTTPKPVAYIENRFLGFLGKSYFITEYLPGPHIGMYFTEHKGDMMKCEAMASKILMLLRNLAKLRITQGDLKMTNILIANHQPHLIDFDGADEHTTAFRLNRAYKQELERFLKNWENNPELTALFKQKMQNDINGKL